MGAKFTLKGLVERLDSFVDSEEFYQFRSHDGVAIGYILPFVARRFERHPEVVTVDHGKKAVTIVASLVSLETRNAAFEALAQSWRDAGAFDCLKGWRNELYTIYNPTHVAYMRVERSMCSLLGIVTYGVHINGYVSPEDSPDGQLRLWVPRRSYKKPTCPGELDNTVAGGLGHPYSPYETCLKECYEEAGLPEEYTKQHLKSCGVASYVYQKSHDLSVEDGAVQPEVEYLYDLKFDRTTIPTPVDGEVHEFYLMTMQEVLERLHAGEFKYNCAGVMIDFLIRHGYITVDMEPDYLTLQQRIHQALPFPTR